MIRQVLAALGHAGGRGAGLRGRRRPGHPGHPGPRPGRDVVVVTGDRDCFQLVEDPHVRVLYNRRGVSDYVALRRGRDRGAHRRGARPVPDAGRAARRPLGQPARASRGWGRRPRPSSSTPTATSTASSPTSTSSAPSSGRTWPTTRTRPDANAAVIPLVRDVPLGSTRGRPRPRGLGPRRGPGRLRRARAAHRVAPAGRPAGEDGAWGPGRRLGPPAWRPSDRPEGASVAPWPVERRTGSGSGAAGDRVAACRHGAGWRSRSTARGRGRRRGRPGRPGRRRRAGAAGGGRPLGGHARARARCVGAGPGGSGPPPERGCGWTPALLSSPAVRTTLAEAAGRRPVVGHHVKELMRSLLPLGIDVTGAGHGHRGGRLPARPLDRSTTASRPWSAVHWRRAPRARSQPSRPGQLALERRGRGGRRGAPGGAPRPRPWPSWWRPCAQRLDAEGLRTPPRRRRAPAGAGAGPHGGGRASGSTPTSCAASPTSWWPTRAPSRPRSTRWPGTSST